MSLNLTTSGRFKARYLREQRPGPEDRPNEDDACVVALQEVNDLKRLYERGRSCSSMSRDMQEIQKLIRGVSESDCRKGEFDKITQFMADMPEMCMSYAYACGDNHPTAGDFLGPNQCRKLESNGQPIPGRNHPRD